MSRVRTIQPMKTTAEQARWDRGRCLAVLDNHGANDLREELGMYEPLPEDSVPQHGNGDRIYGHNAGRITGRAI